MEGCFLCDFPVALSGASCRLRCRLCLVDGISGLGVTNG